MKSMLYTFRSLLRNKGNNLIKILSLTLGLVVGLVLFSQVAFEMSYDNFWTDKDQVYKIHVRGTFNKGDHYDSEAIYLPYAPTMYHEFEEVIAATNLFYFGSGEELFKVGEHSYPEKTIVADSLYIRTMGIPMISGDPEALKVAENIYVSEAFATKAFGTLDVVGQKVVKDEQVLTIAGVMKDIPENSHLKYDVIMSLKNQIGDWNPGWDQTDAFNGYIKVAPGTNVEALEAKIPEMMRRHYDVDAEIAKGVVKTFYLKPVTSLHSGTPQVRRMALILSVLAFSLLFAAALNYVLISISSMAARAKVVGIHKCNGATGRNVIRMFIRESGVLLVISLLLAVLLIYVFRRPIEVLIKNPLSAVFSRDNFWVIGCVVGILFVLTGYIPARIFAAVPVTHIFRSYADNKKGWKRILLFIQFSGVSFMVTFLAIIYFQYQMVLNQNIGYSMDNLVFSSGLYTISQEQMETVKTEFFHLPEISNISQSHLPHRFLSGNSVTHAETGEALFTGRAMYADKHTLETLGLRLLYGRNLSDHSFTNDEVLINETCARMLNVEDPVGYTFLFWAEGRKHTVVGVVEDFQYQSLFEEIPPVILVPEYLPVIVAKLNVPVTPLLMEKLNDLLRKHTNNEQSEFFVLQDEYELRYYDTKLFRNSVIISSVIMLIITLLGLIGFVQDEVGRRQKEIAIRKVNGAEAFNILILLSRDVAFIAVPAVILGLIFSYFVGTEWLQQFMVKIPLGIALFGLSCLSVLTILQVCVVMHSWKVAMENPVLSLKSE